MQSKAPVYSVYTLLPYRNANTASRPKVAPELSPAGDNKNRFVYYGKVLLTFYTTYLYFFTMSLILGFNRSIMLTDNKHCHHLSFIQISIIFYIYVS